MAKTGFWLRGAKGKLAGASLQKGANCEIIIREVVKEKGGADTLCFQPF